MKSRKPYKRSKSSRKPRLSDKQISNHSFKFPWCSKISNKTLYDICRTLSENMPQGMEDTECSYLADECINVLNSVLNKKYKLELVDNFDNFKKWNDFVIEKTPEKSECYVYLIGMYKIGVCNSHWFNIIQCGSGALLCDGWSGHHRYFCRKRAIIPWMNKLEKVLNKYEINEEFMEIFGDNKWSSDDFIIGEDAKLKESGEEYDSSDFYKLTYKGDLNINFSIFYLCYSEYFMNFLLEHI